MAEQGFNIVSERRGNELDIEDEIKELYQLSDSDPTKYAKLTDAFKRMEALHREQRHLYLTSSLPKTVVTRPDKNQPAFSEEAEMLRQTGQREARIPSRTNTVGSGFEILDAPEDTSGGFEIVDPDEPVPQVRKPFHPGQILDAVMMPLGHTLGTTTAAEDLLGAPPREYTGSDPIAKIGYGIAEISHNIAEQVLNAFETPLTWMTAQVGMGIPKAAGLAPGEVAAGPVAAITKNDLDNLVASRAAVRAAYPDPEEVYPSIPLEGKPGDIVEPTLAPGTHTEADKYKRGAKPGGGLYKTAKGEKVETPTVMRQGEFQEITPESTVNEAGEVISALSDEDRVLRSGFDPRFRGLTLRLRDGKLVEPHFKNKVFQEPERLGEVRGTLLNDAGQMDIFAQGGGKRVIGSGDQVDMFEVPLRQQIQFRVEDPLASKDPLSLEGSYNAQYRRYLEQEEGIRPTKYGPETVPKRYDPEKDRPSPKIPLREYLIPQQKMTGKEGVFTPQEMKALGPDPEQGRVPLSIYMSKSGRSASVAPESDLAIPKDLNVENTVGGGVLPSLYARTQRSVVDALDKMGPIGRMAAQMIDNAYTIRARQTATEMGEVERELTRIFGENGWWKRKFVGAKQLWDGENAFIHGSRRRWNITEAEMESLYNTLYTEGRIAPINEKVAEAAKVLYEKGTFPVSSDPGVQGLTMTNPWDPSKPFHHGRPSMFMPQQPIHPITAEAISNTHWNILYERAGGFEGTKVDLNTFKNTIVALSKHDAEVTAFKMKSLQNIRLLDLEALGGSPYQWAKKLGYETDAPRGIYRFNAMGHLRGRFAEIEGPLNELAAKLDGQAQVWFNKARTRAMLNDQGEWDMMEGGKKALRFLSRLTDATSLQSGLLGNLTQMIYPTARAGAIRTSQGIWNMITGTDAEVIRNSGALLPKVLNDMIVPSGPLSRVDSAILSGFGMKKIDRATRWFAAHVGNAQISGLERSLLNNPTSGRLAASIKELGGDPAEILRLGRMPDEMRYEMIQRFANHTAGVTDVRGIPLYATTTNPGWRLVNKYRSFAQANFAEINRMVTDAPNGAVAARRVIELLIGAEVAGAGVNTLREQLSDYFMGAEKNPSKGWVRWAGENLIIGMGALPGMMLVQAMNSQSVPSFVAGVVLGPHGSKGMSLAEDLIGTAKNGFGWRTADTASRSLPIPFSPMFLGPYVKGRARREAKNTAEMKRELSDNEGDGY